MVSTHVRPDGDIEQVLTSSFMGKREELQRSLLKIGEEQIRAQLIKLGWTPPPIIPIVRRCECGNRTAQQDGVSWGYRGNVPTLFCDRCIPL